MNPQQIKYILRAIAFFWVGGWGFLMFRYPEFFAGIGVRLGLTQVATARHIKFTRWLGIFEMILAALSVAGTVLMYALGLNQ